MIPRCLDCLLPLAVLGCLTAFNARAADAPKVFRDRLEPHWFAGDTRFWYRNELPGGQREFIVVDVNAGTRQPAFDHARVARDIAQLSGLSDTAGAFPVSTLEFDTNATTAVSFVLRGDDGSWSLRLDPYELKAVAATDSTREGLPNVPQPRASTRTGPETSILFDNRLTEAVAIFWLNESGERQPYGLLKPKETRRQHTFVGHAWVAVQAGEVVAAFVAERSPARALIDGRPPVSRRGRSTRTERATPPTVSKSPDDAREAFVRDHNLWVRVVATGVEIQLTFDANPGLTFHRDVQRARLIGMDYEAPEPPATLPEVHWSPDSRRLIAVQTRTVPERRVQLVESSPRDQLQPKTSSYPYLKAGDDIPTQAPRLFDVESGREWTFPRDAFANPWSVEDFRWAPDNSRVTCLFNQRGHQALRVIAITPPTSPDPDAHATVSVIVDETSPTFVDYSNKTFLEFLDATGELVWMSERDGWNHLYLVDSKSGGVKNPITHGEWVVRGVDKVDAAARQVWFRACGIRPGQDPYQVHLARVNFDGSSLVVLTEGDGTHEIQWSPDRRHFIDTWSRVDQPPTIELRRASDGGRVVELERADASEVLAARGRFPERFVAKGRDGKTDIWGIIHRPARFEAVRKYPVIENIYAGPHDQHVPKSFRAAYRNQEELADRGFVVVQIDGMGTNWRGKRFHDVAWKNIADAGFPDRIAWLKAAAAKFPELDISRVGVYGGSAGGQNALGALLTHGDFYRAAVADCGCHDNRMDKIWWSEAWMGWPVGPHYAEQSNVTMAKRLTGKLMLFVGELDRNVDPSSTYQVANALIRADKDFDFVVMTGSGHGSAESDYGRRRRAEFFVRALQSPQQN